MIVEEYRISNDVSMLKRVSMMKMIKMMKKTARKVD